MRIVVVSDTHISRPETSLPKKLENEIEKSDFCLHAGDLTIYPVYQKLAQKIKTYCVAGNMDQELVCQHLPEKEIINLKGFTIGLIHGRGAPGTIIEHINYQFRQDYSKINLFVFGHLHQPVNKEKNGKIYFNPGSIGDTIVSLNRTYGIIEIVNGKIKRSLKKIA